MVKCFICLFLLLFVGCNYTLIPRSYFSEYTKIAEEKSKNDFYLNYRRPYVSEDTFLSRYYSEKLNRNIKSYNYIFFYENNLMSEITVPLFSNNKPFGLSNHELEDSIKTGFFERQENRSNIHWTYFDVRKGKVVSYSFTYNVASGANALTPVIVIESNFIKYRDGFVPEYSFNQNREIEMNYNVYRESQLSIKPDSSKSDFIRSYQKYIDTGKRRHYPYYKDFEKYINKK